MQTRACLNPHTDTQTFRRRNASREPRAAAPGEIQVKVRSIKKSWTLRSADLFLPQSRGQRERNRERERASCIMHGSVEQQWLLHCTLSLGFQVSVLSVKQAAYRRARCSHMTLYLSCLRAQGHQPIQLLGLSLRTQDLTGSLIRTSLWSGRAFRSWRGKTSTYSCILYSPGWNAIPFCGRKKELLLHISCKDWQFLFRWQLVNWAHFRSNRFRPK